MYPNQNMNYYQMNRLPNRPPMNEGNDDRFVGGFLGPFLLGGITGGLLAPAFYPRPYYPRPYYPYPPYPPYPPYYYGPYPR